MQKIVRESDSSAIGVQSDGVDVNRNMITNAEASLHMPKRLCLTKEFESLSIYSPFGGFDRFSYPYKEVILLGSTFAELAQIKDIEVSLVESNGKSKGSKLGNSDHAVPDKLARFLAHFDVETSSKSINRYKTNIRAGRNTDRRGNNHIKLTLQYELKNDWKPLAGRTVRVLLELPSSSPTSYGNYVSNAEGNIEFQGPNSGTLRPVTKMHFEYSGDDEYADTRMEMGIR